MADAFFTINLETRVLRRADGLIWGVQVYHPKVVDTLFWLNRETDDLEQLQPYRVGMFGRRRHA